MRKNSKIDRYQFLQKEEAWIIRALVTIEKTKEPSDDERRIIDSMVRSLLVKKSDPFIDTFEGFLEITVRYGIEEAKPGSMEGFTEQPGFYIGVGNGEYYRLMKDGKDNLEKRREARQNKRDKAYEKTAAQYESYSDILENAVFIERIRELEARIHELENRQPVMIDPSVIQPTEHSLDNLEQFAESSKKQPSPRMMRIREVMNERREREVAWLQ